MVDYEIIVAKQFASKHLQISHKPIKLRRRKFAKKFITANWNKMKRKNPTLFAGPLVSVKQYNFSEKSLQIETIRTSYDDFLASKESNFFKNFPSEKPANPLSVGSIVITSDNKIVLGVRNQNVSIEKNSLSVPSGMVDDNDICNDHVDCFNAVKREISEEIQIPKSSLIQISCLGLVWNEKAKQTYIPFFCKTRKSSSDICKIFHPEEFDSLRFVPNNKTQIKKILQLDLADIAKPTIEIYLDLFSEINRLPK